MRNKIPIYIDISKFNILILGGGREAAKKTKRYLKYTQSIIIYSLEFDRELLDLAEKNSIRLIRGDARDLSAIDPLIKKSDLIVYTIPGLDDLERWVKRKCEEYRKIYILSTNADETMAAMPPEIEVHGLRFTAFSNGKSTLVSLEALGIIEDCLKDKKYIATLLEAMHYLKTYMKKHGVHYKLRMKIYRSIFRQPEFRGYVYQGNLEGAINYIDSFVKEAVKTENKN
jgi:siroheme synthase (precorrin-2 oxidase/ferrochelatase)